MRSSWFDFTPGKGFFALLAALTVTGVSGNDIGGLGFFGLAGLAVASMARGGERRAAKRGGGSAEEILERRLATGEISIEEFYDREAVLRNSDTKLLKPGTARRA